MLFLMLTMVIVAVLSYVYSSSVVRVGAYIIHIRTFTISYFQVLEFTQM